MCVSRTFVNARSVISTRRKQQTHRTCPWQTSRLRGERHPRWPSQQPIRFSTTFSQASRDCLQRSHKLSIHAKLIKMLAKDDVDGTQSGNFLNGTHPPYPYIGPTYLKYLTLLPTTRSPLCVTIGPTQPTAPSRKTSDGRLSPPGLNFLSCCTHRPPAYLPCKTTMTESPTPGRGGSTVV